MSITPDQIIYWAYGFITINKTLVMTWGIMAFMVISSWLITRNISPAAPVTGIQGLLETIVVTVNSQIEEIGLKRPERYLGFIGTLVLFIAVSNLAIVFPGYHPPTASLSTTAALALCVFFAVPVYNISGNGLANYIRSYARPNIIMVPFNIIGEFTRTLSLAFRLFGNIMSGEMIVSILLTITPFFFPVVMNVLGLLTGAIQAYIFGILATVYIAAAAGET